MQITGTRSVSGNKRVMSLPKDFCDYHNIQRRERVDVQYDQLFVIIPKGVKLTPANKRLLKELIAGGKDND